MCAACCMYGAIRSSFISKNHRRARLTFTGSHVTRCQAISLNIAPSLHNTAPKRIFCRLRYEKRIQGNMQCIPHGTYSCCDANDCFIENKVTLKDEKKKKLSYGLFFPHFLISSSAKVFSFIMNKEEKKTLYLIPFSNSAFTLFLSL